jgi:hypothetical protein
MSIPESMFSRGWWEAGKAGVNRLLGGRIKITVPGGDGILSQPEPFYGGQAYVVRGTLKRLPRGHQIWLLTEDYPGGPVRPHGFFPIIYNDKEHTWWGRINPMGKQRFKLVPVVAPPTSHEFFTYYQQVGKATGFEALKRIPPECRNMAAVQAFIP